ncbi:MAG: hypothetical protein R3A79_06575 [Nannocystaceae bacterium]
MTDARDDDGPRASALGRRIHVIGNTGAGKSTLAAQLAAALGIPLVELDALNWQPGWVDLTRADPAQFERRLAAATAGDAWVVAGSYSRFCQRIFWSRVETVIWLDLSLPRIVARILRRSWRRWRTREHLWGTNYERFWPQLRLWSDDSLIRWALTQHGRKRRWTLAQGLDPRWRAIRFIRLRAPAEVAALLRAAERGGDASS